MTTQRRQYTALVILCLMILRIIIYVAIYYCFNFIFLLYLYFLLINFFNYDFFTSLWTLLYCQCIIVHMCMGFVFVRSTSDCWNCRHLQQPTSIILQRTHIDNSAPTQARTFCRPCHRFVYARVTRETWPRFARVYLYWFIPVAICVCNTSFQIKWSVCIYAEKWSYSWQISHQQSYFHEIV